MKMKTTNVGLFLIFAGARVARTSARIMVDNNYGRWGPYRQASPSPAGHRSGARSARRDGVAIVSQTLPAKETTMWFHSLFASLTKARHVRRANNRRLHFETLEDRTVPAVPSPVFRAVGDALLPA